MFTLRSSILDEFPPNRETYQLPTENFHSHPMKIPSSLLSFLVFWGLHNKQNPLHLRLQKTVSSRGLLFAPSFSWSMCIWMTFLVINQWTTWATLLSVRPICIAGVKAQTWIEAVVLFRYAKRSWTRQDRKGEMQKKSTAEFQRLRNCVQLVLFNFWRTKGDPMNPHDKSQISEGWVKYK